MKAQRSLKGRALQWLAQREQSRSELRRKLLPHAVAESQVDRGPQADAQADLSPIARVDAVLDWLEAQGHLSQERFAESRVHARAPRFGNLRIRQELQRHQIALSPEAQQALRNSEFQRAGAVLARKFADPPQTVAERAKQARFLAGRGFSPEAIAQALRRDGAEQHATFDG